MKTILYAHTGSGNHGCEALVRSTASLLSEHPLLMSTAPDEDLAWGLDKIASVQHDRSSPVKPHSPAYYLAAVQTKLTGSSALFTKYTRQALLAQVNAGDLCLSIGGDNYCYAGTEILGDLNLLMRKKHAKTVLWGCSIDPEAITPAMAADLKQYDMITVREPLTQAALAEAGVIENVRKVADSAFLLHAEQTQLPQGFLPGKTIGLNVSPLIFKYTDRREDALSSFYALVRHILDTTDNSVALIPHVVKDGNSDLVVLTPIYEKFKDSGRVLLIPDQNCMRLKYIISQCRLFIGARTHATIAAYSTCVPTLVVGYSIKSRGIALDLFGSEENYVLPVQRIQNDADMIQAYTWLETHAAEMKDTLRSVIPGYQEQSRLAKTYLDELSAR